MQIRHVHNDGSVKKTLMVWAGVNTDKRRDLVAIPGILNRQQYIDEVLRPHVLPFLQQIGMNNAMFQDDTGPELWMHFFSRCS